MEETKEDQKPSKTLFVVNFDVMRTSIRDIEDFYHRYGRLRRVDIKRNYAFVEFDRCGGGVVRGAGSLAAHVRAARRLLS